jgi:hypothetical protein
MSLWQPRALEREHGSGHPERSRSSECSEGEGSLPQRVEMLRRSFAPLRARLGVPRRVVLLRQDGAPHRVRWKGATSTLTRNCGASARLIMTA